MFQKKSGLFSQTTDKTREIHPFFNLPSTTDCFHDIDQFKENIPLHPMDYPYEDFRQYSKTKQDFGLLDLESKDLEKLIKAVNIVQKFFKDAAEVSNSNIVRNVNNLLAALAHDNDKVIAWIGTMKQRIDSGKYKLFRKYLKFTDQICEYKVWNDCVRENIISFYYVLR